MAMHILQFVPAFAVEVVELAEDFVVAGTASLQRPLGAGSVCNDAPV
jgi:hypothetical protein